MVDNAGDGLRVVMVKEGCWPMVNGKGLATVEPRSARFPFWLMFI